MFSVLCIKLTITDCVDLFLAIFHDCVITIVAVCVSSCHWSKRNSTDVLLVTVVPVSVAPGSGHSAHTGTGGGGHYLCDTLTHTHAGNHCCMPCHFI